MLGRKSKETKAASQSWRQRVFSSSQECNHSVLLLFFLLKQMLASTHTTTYNTDWVIKEQFMSLNVASAVKANLRRGGCVSNSCAVGTFSSSSHSEMLAQTDLKCISSSSAPFFLTNANSFSLLKHCSLQSKSTPNHEATYERSMHRLLTASPYYLHKHKQTDLH